MEQQVGKKIKMYREYRRITQKQLSEMSGVSEVSIGLYETGARIPKPAQIKAIANGLHISVHAIHDIDIATCSDVASILFQLNDAVDLKLKEVDGKIAVVFENQQINNFLMKWTDINKAIENIYENVTEDSERRAEEIQKNFRMQEMNTNFVVKKGTADVLFKI